jgi:long-subunit acyl-CoA synthetase (AMP-forming)
MESAALSQDMQTEVEATTLSAAIRMTVAAHPEIVAFRTVDGSISLTWGEVGERVDRVAAGLAALGVVKGDRVAIMLSNRPEFNIVDLAAVTLGAVPFSIYNTYPAEQINYLLGHSGAKLVITEQAFLAVVSEAAAPLPAVANLILVDTQGTEAPSGTLALEAVEALGDPAFDAAASAAEVGPEDIATLIYTSGTTGPPKGVELTHHNVMAGAMLITYIIEFPAGSKVISWLPAAHIAERMAHHYVPTVHAGTVTVCPNPREIAAFLPQVRPNWFFAVPRIWEKLKAGLEAMQAGQDEAARAPVQKALADSLEAVRLRQRGEEVPAELAERVAIADRDMFSHLRHMLGLDEVLAVSVGAAPLAVDVIEFFHALGIELSELWGMSETTGAGLCNRPGHIKIGSVGTTVPGVEVRTAEDGELLIRGDVVMHGYRDAPEKTAEALDAEGWLHTGDIATIDAEGYVKIVDRKKELIINSAGKNMSPANIEAALKSGGPIIGQACVIGDARPFNTALIVLDPDYAPVWAAQHELGGKSVTELTSEPAIRELVQAAIDNANTKLARVEQVKRFTIVETDWLPGGDELTPTMKLKRKPIGEKYASAIDAMYA